jgi:hypothetical protein
VRTIQERNKLAEANLWIVKYVISKLWNLNVVRRFGQDQAASAGQWALLRAAQYWSDDGRPFFTYAASAIKKRILQDSLHYVYGESYWLWKVGKPPKAVFVYDDLKNVKAEQTEWIRGDDVAAVNRAVEMLSKVTSRRGHSVGQIVRMLLDGQTPKQIGSKLGIGRRAVSMAKRAGIKRIREILEG